MCRKMALDTQQNKKIHPENHTRKRFNPLKPTTQLNPVDFLEKQAPWLPFLVGILTVVFFFVGGGTPKTSNK